jgi:mono/diheme cytochrome c family protein
MDGSRWLRSRRLFARVAGGLFLLTLALTASFAISRSSGAPATPAEAARQAAIDPHVAAGALNYITYGCENCHGLYGRGGVKVPNISGSATIPALNTPLVLKSLSVPALRAFIEHGVVYATKTTQVYMPVWGTVLSDRQLADLISYIRAGLPQISGISPQPVRTDLGLQVEGQQLYVRYGCVVCHAFNGFGGVPNPASPDKLVPPLRGTAFDKQFTKDSEIAYVIKHGSIIGQPPIVSMPVWSGLLSDQQINAIVAYIRSFQ